MKTRNKWLGCIVVAASSTAVYAQSDSMPADNSVAPSASVASDAMPTASDSAPDASLTSLDANTSMPEAAGADTVSPLSPGADASAPVESAEPAEAPAAALTDSAPISTAAVSESPLLEGPYVAPMATYVLTTEGNTDDGYGGALSLGYRKDWYALEAQFIYSSLSGNGSGSTNEIGGGLYGLVFPFKSLPNLYGIVGAGALQIKGYPGASGKSDFGPTTASGGLGYLWSISSGRYDFAVRTEALYRYGRRESEVNPRRDHDAPNNLGDVVFNIGLQLPLGLKPIPVAAPAEPVNVVPVLPPADSDGDGVTDDKDQCPNTPSGTQVNDVGCPLPPPCKPPEAGQKVDLSGCAVGDSIVLRGVNFEFNKSKLTVNAQTILDGVADALVAAPAVSVEIDGYTDSKGSDAYNQKLSESRAQAVMQYLGEHGIAAARMSAVGLGETQPIADNDTDEGRELNRRVELKITSAAASASEATSADSATPQNGASAVDSVETMPAGDSPASADDMSAPLPDASASDAAPADPLQPESSTGQ